MLRCTARAVGTTADGRFGAREAVCKPSAREASRPATACCIGANMKGELDGTLHAPRPETPSVARRCRHSNSRRGWIPRIAKGQPQLRTRLTPLFCLTRVPRAQAQRLRWGGAPWRGPGQRGQACEDRKYLFGGVDFSEDPAPRYIRAQRSPSMQPRRLYIFQVRERIRSTYLYGEPHGGRISQQLEQERESKEGPMS